jgi:hypothetical protein
MRDALKNHVLEEALQKTGEFQAFYLKEPGQGRMMSTLFVFTPEGIVICGDLCPGGPGNQGSISNFGYGLGWFSGRLSEGYLCEKFLSREWQPKVAEEWCREHIEELKKEAAEEKKAVEKLEDWEDLLDSLTVREIGNDRFHEALQDLDYYVEDEGYDYPLSSAGWLCVLQQRFAEEYAKLVPAQAASK